MQIKLHQIKSHPQPVRTTWDEAEMDKLAHSIKTQGQLQPIKVRPVGDERYEVVFGHRRVEACRRAKIRYIEAMVEDVDDQTVLIQALIENVVREDLGPMDKARGLQALKDATGWSTRDIEKQGIMSQSGVVQLLKLLDEPEEIQEMLTGQSRSDHPVITPITERHVRAIRSAELSNGDKVIVLRKATTEGLTSKQTRTLADAYRRVRSDHVAKEKLLKMPFTKSTEHLEGMAEYRAAEVRAKTNVVYDHQDDLNVKAFIEAIKGASRGIEEQWQVVEHDMVGAEHMPYLAKRLRLLADRLSSMASQLDEKRKEEIGE